MQVLISGTNTDIGKTIIASWLCWHTGAAYFKPIQTGPAASYDSVILSNLTTAKIYPEIFKYPTPVAPYLAANFANSTIDLTKISLPTKEKLIVEGAGGLMVPLNDRFYMIDLIKQLGLPVILVANAKLGTINHTLLSLEALRHRQIPVLGVIINRYDVNNNYDQHNKNALETYGNIKVLAEFPELNQLNPQTLAKIHLPLPLTELLQTLT